MMMVGGLRPRHVIPAFEDLGMKVIGTGYEFGHGDDYKRTADYVKEGTLSSTTMSAALSSKN
jgi:nitrogenase molybdenum-iron protein alpha chain